MNATISVRVLRELALYLDAVARGVDSQNPGRATVEWLLEEVRRAVEAAPLVPTPKPEGGAP